MSYCNEFRLLFALKVQAQERICVLVDPGGSHLLRHRHALFGALSTPL